MAGDNDEIAKVRNNIRAETRIGWSLLAAIAVDGAIFAGAMEFHIPMENAGIAAFAVLLLWIALVFRTQRNVTPHAGYDASEDLLRKTIDDQHRRWRWYFTFMFLVVGFLAFISSFVALSPVSLLAKGSPVMLAVSINFMIWAVIVAFQVCFGPSFGRRGYRRAVSDELTRALQGKAAMFGYLLSVVAMCVVLGITATRWQWGLAAMPAAIATVVILPGLYFLIQQWRAGRSDG